MSNFVFKIEVDYDFVGDVDELLEEAVALSSKLNLKVVFEFKDDKYDIYPNGSHYRDRV